MSEASLRVWAPRAERVDAVIGATDQHRVPMHAEAEGWWQVTTPVGDGRYAFSLDGGPSLPDPRSLSQPDGVHAASELVDLTAHEWSDTGWAGQELQGAVLYELHLGTFTPEGTFDAAIEHLDHLAHLGVTMVSLLPVAAFPGRHGWGYDGVALYAVHDGYGGASGLQRFVDACHSHGLSVCLDVVYNHLGPNGNYLAQFGPYFTSEHHTPWGEAVNLDGPHSDQVRAFIIDNARMWLTDFHLDALRLDAVHELHDRRAVTLLEELAACADEVATATGVPRHLIAESDRNDPATVTPRQPGGGGAGGLGLTAQWADDIHHTLHVALTGEVQGYYADFAAPDALAKVLVTTPFFHDGTHSTFRGRRHGRAVVPEQTPGWRFVAALQTHDQVGNRATGDRLAHLVPPGVAAAGAALLLTSPYTPMLFMGEEWAASTPWQYFTDHDDPELAAAISTGRVAEFAGHGWAGAVPDPQHPSTVAASVLDWTELGRPDHAAMLEWYRFLLRLRRTEPALAQARLGEGELWFDRSRQAVTLLRPGRRPVLVVATLAEHDAAPSLPNGDWHLAGEWGQVRFDTGECWLGGHSVAVLTSADAPEPNGT